MDIFVTGFGGYVGSHAVEALRASGARISVLVRDEASASKAENVGLVPVVADLARPESLSAAVAAVDAVAHFAASDSPAFLPINTAAIDAMVSALRPGAAFLTHGGSMVFGEQGRLSPARDPEFNPPPGLAGRADLDRSLLERGRNGRRVFIVYGSFVFGGRGAMIPNALASAAAATGSSAYPEDSSAIWSGVHIEDWVDLMARVILSDDQGGRPVFAAAQDISIIDAARALAGAFDPPLSTRSVALEEGRRLWPFFADGFKLYQRFDPEEAQLRFGWSPSPRIMSSAFKQAIAAAGHPA